MFKRKLLVNALILAGLSGGFYSTAWAATTNVVEGTDSTDCGSAQDFSDKALPISLKGKLGGISPPDDTDDYFSFTAPVGTSVVVKATAGTPSVPFLNVLGSPDENGDCATLSYENDKFTVPEDGKFIVKASDIESVYTLSIAEEPPVPPVPTVDSISTKIVDTAGKPIKGIYARLLTCVKRQGCYNTPGVSPALSNSKGKIEWNSNFGDELAPATYKIVANEGFYDYENDRYYPENLGYSADSSPKFAAAEDEEKVVDNIVLEGKKAVLSMKDCIVGDTVFLPGVCRFSVGITNKSTAVLKGKAEATLTGYGLYEEDERTSIKLSSAQPVNLKAGAKTNPALSFSFMPPNDADVLDGAEICYQVDVSEGNRKFGSKILASIESGTCLVYSEGLGWNSHARFNIFKK
ncbi:exported hypothetical protein [Crenothrix polyspora]|uniref:Carboxypeptidase regulatory-like domain-containing protein n=1 Tax=Crenothrix polyspora TaxID=360316 RepID=A0A1R4H2G1_9GAMM|nr:hypothetical protein [Crenothrix polyspora]SJM90366.1 exported hypothetical protein [Crenothrix polyspora]